MALTMGVSAYAQFEKAPLNTPKNGAKTTWSQIGTPFVATDINGNTVDVAAILNSGKGIVIDYSACWCGPCWNMHSSGLLEAIQNQLGNDVQVIWCEIEEENGSDELYGLGGQTYGNWTVDANNNPLPYPIIDDESTLNMCISLYEGYIPSIYYIAPNGYFRDIYSDDGITPDMTAAQAVANIQTIMQNAPQAGVAPVVNINGPTTAVNGSNATFTVDIVSVDSITNISWTATGATVTSGNAATFTTSWTTDGTYTVSVSVTNTTGTTTKDITVNVISWNWGNTMSYLISEEYGSSVGTGGAIHWGAMFPAEFMTGRQYLKSVDFYAPKGGKYTLNVYQGGDNAPQTKIYTRVHQIPVTAQAGWVTINCSGAVQLDQTKNLWVTFNTTTIDYPAAGAAYSGDPNGSLVSLDGASWMTIQAASSGSLDYTWMIKATTGDQPNAGISTLSNVELNVYPNPTTGIVNIDAEGIENVEVMDMTGRTVMTANGSTVDMSALNNGVYMLRVNTVNGSSLQKIVKK